MVFVPQLIVSILLQDAYSNVLTHKANRFRDGLIGIHV